MLVDAVIVVRTDKIQVFSPRYAKGLPVLTLDLKHEDKKVKLVTCWDDVDKDKPNCACETIQCSTNDVPRNVIKKCVIPRNSCISCECDDTIYVLMPEIFIK